MAISRRCLYKNARGHHDLGRLRFPKPAIRLITRQLRLSEQHCERAWGFYGHRLNLYRHTEPHAGYQILLNWGKKMQHRYQVFTSNVDGHFHKAGFDNMHVHECHGSIHYLQCLEPCCEQVWSASEFVPEVDTEYCRLRNHIPRCNHCGKMTRPNILMFNDVDWIYARTRKQHLYQERWLEQVNRPVVIELGAGTAIPSVRHFSQRMQHEFNAKLIRINPCESMLLNNHSIHLPIGAYAALQQIQQALAVSTGRDWIIE